MAVTLTQLTAFLAVVRGGSVTAAAQELVVTQPSVSAAVSALSREVGVDLIERDGRGVRLTPAGVEFAAYATEVVGLLDQGARAARTAAEAGDHELRLSAVTTAGEYLAPPLIQAFTARRSDVAVSLDVGNRARVHRRLLSREADVAIAGRAPEDGHLRSTAFLDNEIVVITHAGDPLARRRSVPAAALADRVWLLREEGSGSRTMTEEFLAGHGLHPRALTLGSNGAIKHAVRAELGVALQPRIAVAIELHAGLLRTVRLQAPLSARQWHVLTPARGPVRPAVEAFVAFVRSREARAAIDGSRRLVESTIDAALTRR